MDEKEKEIVEKLNNYKLLLSSELLSEINKEKVNEAKLMDYYENADEKDKPKILESINEEKTKSAERIIQLNEEMSKKYKEFEQKLRNGN